jgi:hypothetical protein
LGSKTTPFWASKRRRFGHFIINFFFKKKKKIKKKKENIKKKKKKRKRKAQWRHCLARAVRGGHTAVACERTTWSRRTAGDR